MMITRQSKKWLAVGVTVHGTSIALASLNERKADRQTDRQTDLTDFCHGRPVALLTLINPNNTHHQSWMMT